MNNKPVTYQFSHVTPLRYYRLSDGAKVSYCTLHATQNGKDIRFYATGAVAEQLVMQSIGKTADNFIDITAMDGIGLRYDVNEYMAVPLNVVTDFTFHTF